MMEASDWIKLIGVVATQVVAIVAAGIAIWVKLAVLETTVKEMQKCITEYDITHEDIRKEMRSRGEQQWKEIQKLRDRMTRAEGNRRRHNERDDDDDTHCK